MNKIILILITASMFFTKGYAQQAEVLTLGVFHFEFPNLDVQQISEEDQIDVLSPQYQKEIELISKKLAQFKPDAVVIEWPLYKQSEIDSLYNSYLTGKHELNRNEIQQLGFRIARMCNAKIYCADAWGNCWIMMKVMNIWLLKKVSRTLPTLLYTMKMNPSSSNREYLHN